MMRKKENRVFFAKVAAAFVLIAGFIFVGVLPQYSQGYNASILDKMDRLKAIDGPKLVLVGNSNLPFGIDSALLEAELGMPVVNLGLHGGLTNAFHERMALANVQAGDLYVVVHTEYDDDDQTHDPSLAWITIENHVGLYGLLRAKDLGIMKEGFSSYFRKALGLWTARAGNQATPDAYARGAFNEYGDNVFPRPEPSGEVIPFDEQTVSEVSDVCVNRLNALSAQISARGAQMVVAAFPIAYGYDSPPEDDFIALQDTLTERLDCPVISYFPDYMYPYGYFYDTIFHLTDEAVTLRTEQLIYDIRHWQDGGVPGEV